jgi:methionyl-tRNA formyltransferase
MKNICVAGKNQIAIDAIIHLLDKYKDANLFFLENKGDFGVDGWQPSYKKFCLENKIRSTSLVELYEMDQLVFISLEYDQILRTAKFKSKNLFNIHFSLLPKYKGMYTSAMPLLNGEKNTGVTLHLIDDGIDTGDIIDQIDFPIEKNHTARDVYFNYLLYGSKLFVKNIDSLLTGGFKSWPQSSHNSV